MTLEEGMTMKLVSVTLEQGVTEVSLTLELGVTVKLVRVTLE